MLPSARSIVHIVSLVIAVVLPFAAATAMRAPQAVLAAPALQTLVVAGGQPDDITVDAHGHLVWGDLAAGTVRRLVGRRVITVATGLSVPEGIIALPNGNLVVAEQGRDRIVQIGHRGSLRVLAVLSPVAGQEGVDGIGRDQRTGNLIIPDSPHGTVLSRGANGRLRTVASGLGRPVDAAVDHHGNILVPDEHLGTLIEVTPRGIIHHLGVLATPDDVAVDARGVIWVTTLGDGGLWRMKPGARPEEILSGLANPQGLTLDRCGNPIVVDQNTTRIVRVLLTAHARRCVY